jgi:hypothetical protein
MTFETGKFIKDAIAYRRKNNLRGHKIFFLISITYFPPNFNNIAYGFLERTL